MAMINTTTQLSDSVVATTFQTRTQQKIDSANNWSLINPVLLKGEIGVALTLENDTEVAAWIKIGDGYTPWNYLPWAQQNGTETHILYDTTEHWNTLQQPSQRNTIYVYTDGYSTTISDTVVVEYRVKIGDGVTWPVNLSFIDTPLARIVNQHISDTDAHVQNTQQRNEREFWNNKVRIAGIQDETIVFTEF